MVQRRDRFRFTLEPGQAIGDLCGVFGQHFDLDLATQTGVPSPIHVAHRTGADGADDFVRAQTRAADQRHEMEPSMTLLGLGTSVLWPPAVASQGFHAAVSGAARFARGSRPL